MTYGVDAPRGVVNKKHPHQAAPKQSGQGALPRSAEKAANNSRNEQTKRNPKQVIAIDGHDLAIAHKVADQPAVILELVRKHPPRMGVPPAAEHGQGPGSERMWRMRITILVTELVMPSMAGSPEKNGSLRSHATGNAKAGRHRRYTLETAMGEEAMESHGNAKTGDQVHQAADKEVHASDQPAPEQDYRRDKSDQRKKHRGQSYAPFHFLQPLFGI